MESLKQQLQNLVNQLQLTTDEVKMHQINIEMLAFIQAYICNNFRTIVYYDQIIDIDTIDWKSDNQLLGIIGVLAEVDDNFADTIRPVFFECDEMEFWALMRELVEESSLLKC